MQNDLDISQVVLFGPRSGKSLRRLYREIDENLVFKGLSHEDLLFSWLMGIPGSPVDHEWPDNVRLRTAAARSFGSNDFKKSKYVAGDIPDEVKKAIREFEGMSPEARLKAKNMQQRILINYEKIVNQDASEMDNDEKKKYVESTVKISESLPDILKRIEEGYGLTENRKTEETEKKTIHTYHQNRKES